MSCMIIQNQCNGGVYQDFGDSVGYSIEVF